MKEKKNILAVQPYYNRTCSFCKPSITTKNKKVEVIMNKHVNLGLSVLDLNFSKTLM